MILNINGKSKTLQDSLNLSDLLKFLNISNYYIAVELNHKIVPKIQFENTQLKNDDKIEIVQFVGGG